MALSVDYIYTFSKKLVRKNQSAGISSTDFQYHWNDASASYMDDLLGRFQARNNGKEGLQTGLIENETILTKLAPFTKPAILSIAGGNADKPDDFIFTLALRINDKKVTKITHGKIYAALESVIDSPSIAEDCYYYTEYENYYLFLPTAVTSADLDYISQVNEVVWGFTFDGDGRPVYDAGTSIQPLWDNASCREIKKRMLKALGVSFKDQDFANFGQSVITQGE